MDTVLELLPFELRGLTPHIRLPCRTKVFWGMFPFKHHYHPNSHQLKHNIFVFFYVCHWINSEFSPVVYIVIYGSAYLGYIWWNSWWHFFCGTHIEKLFKWTHIQQNTFFTHSDLSVGEAEHKWVGCSLQCIKIQTQYTVRHNTIKCHSALCYKFQFIRTISDNLC